MPKNPNIKKVLVIGSGPIVIGQAAEFDYAGTQACRSLKEEGIEVVLVNSNPATIMTDKDIADEVYIEPLTVKALEQIILKEKPDSILPTLGGQAGLNLAMEIAETGFLDEHNVKLIGTTALTIKKAEDRLMFKETMEKIGEPCAASLVVNDVESGEAFAAKIGYPVVLRPAYTLGGSGGGIAHNVTELREILENGLRLSRVGEVLVERCIAGWKEIEYEVMRDSNGNCITVCNMENIDNVRVTAINDKYQGHAYNYIKIFDKWYLSCTTFGSHRMELKENEYYIVPSLNMFLTNYQTPYASNWGYDSKMHEDIKEKIESQSNFELSIIDNLNSFKEIIESYHLNSLLNIEVEFQYFKDINLFKEDIEKEYPSYEIVLLKNLPYENNYYSIIFLSNI